MSRIKTNMITVTIPDRVPDLSKIKSFWIAKSCETGIIRVYDQFFLTFYGSQMGIIEEVDHIPLKRGGLYLENKDLGKENIAIIFKELEKRITRLEFKVNEILKNNKPSIEDEYSDLKWIPFTKTPGFWIRANDGDEKVEDLLRRLKDANGKVIFTDSFRYQLSPDGKFIRRYPRKY